MTALARSNRIRRTWWTDAVEAAGCSAFSVYNRMLLPAVFRSLEEDCAHLKAHVQLWDVSCERQVEIEGPDAARLVQLMTPRNLSKAEEGQCLYIPIVDERGGMLNDPVAVKRAEDRWWISIADSDLLLYAKGLALGRGLHVIIREPDVNILAVQGPKSEELMTRIFGEAVREVRFFRGISLPFQGVPQFMARSGYSTQTGFEIYVEGSEHAEPLWDAMMEAGADLDVRAGCPNLIERIESGLLSYGNDMTAENTPYECGLGRLCKDAAALECIGNEALVREASEGPRRMIRGLRISGGAVPACREPWPVESDGRRVGRVTSATWSPDLRTNVAIAMIERDWWEPETVLTVQAPDGARQATVQTLPFIPRPS